MKLNKAELRVKRNTENFYCLDCILKIWDWVIAKKPLRKLNFSITNWPANLSIKQNILKNTLALKLSQAFSSTQNIANTNVTVSANHKLRRQRQTRIIHR